MRLHLMSIGCALLSTLVVAGGDREFVYDGRLYSYDQAMTMSAPPEGLIVRADDRDCRARMERELQISSKIFDVIELSEGASNGFAKSWPTKSGGITWDTGKYSVNEVNWGRMLQYGLTPFDLRWDDCASLVASSLVMMQFYEQAKESFKAMVVSGEEPIKILEVVAEELAGYNSRNPAVRKRYAKRLTLMMVRNLFEGEDFGVWDE